MRGRRLAEIIEDRGNLAGGRQLFRVQTMDELEDARLCFEIPAEQISPIEFPVRAEDVDPLAMDRESGPGARSRKRARWPRLRAGQRVLISFGGAPTLARIIEDRGYIGPEGQQIVRVEVLDADDREPFEVLSENAIPLG